MNEPAPVTASRLPKPPKETNSTTPLKIIESGIYTREQLLETILTKITEGKTYRSIAKELNIKLNSLAMFLSTAEHLAPTRQALKISADYYADMSIQVLKSAPSDKLELMRARELSSAYRWMARVRDVSKYGEKLDVTTDGQSINIVSLGNGIAPPEVVNTIDITHTEE